MQRSKLEGGFSLLSLNLLMCFFVGILALVLFTINPAKQNVQTMNMKRMADLKLIANALGQYLYYNDARLPATVSSKPQEIAASGVDLCAKLLPDYLTTLPSDPLIESPGVIFPCPEGYRTGYYMRINNDNTFTLSASPNGKEEAISETRVIRKKLSQ